MSKKNITEKIDKLIWKQDFPDPKEYFRLFETTGWNNQYRFNEDELIWAIQNSWYALSVYYKQKLVGFGRIISDGVHHALIVDIIVHPGYQGKGIGGEILQNLINRCKRYQIRDVQLFCARGKSEFYEKHGFKPRLPDAPGMQLSSGFAD
ncbi:MAG: GNAT family N-acetyltransferase [Bacteroidetes bacterium]|nr:GNAT family N-acetyltransferase [Bacteroidota bacterium]